MTEQEHHCRFPHDPPEPAMVLLDTPEGCTCYPEDIEQALCMQHFLKGGMNGDWDIKEWLTEDGCDPRHH